jgi:C4-dicarboxylate-specific signal transduction histidine kinase
MLSAKSESPVCTLPETQAASRDLDALLDSIDTAVCVADFAPGRLLYVNEPFRKHFAGCDAGQRLAEFESRFSVAPSERFPRPSLIDADGLPDCAMAGDFRCLAQDRWYRVRARAIRWGAEALVRLHTLADITERVESERFQQAQQEKLLQTSRFMSVGEMASTLAHELNQPLGAIINYLNGGLRRVQSRQTSEAELVQVLAMARIQAEHAAAIIARIREFVRTREPRREPVALSDLMNTITKLLDLEASKHQVCIELDLPLDLPLVLADRVMIEQVALNLVKNAIEAMREAPLRERKVHVSARENLDGLMEVAIADRGHGLSEQAADQLFSPFFTTKNDGMGIGLNICRSIVEYHQGRLYFRNNADRGSTFLFTLPRFDSRSG